MNIDLNTKKFFRCVLLIVEQIKYGCDEQKWQ